MPLGAANGKWGGKTKRIKSVITKNALHIDQDQYLQNVPLDRTIGEATFPH